MNKFVLVEYLGSLNTVICDTFKSTQRIKLTSFDVSLQYILIGTSSGGIYIFKRNPCEFLRLIPSKEGPAIQLGISPNEKNLAAATSKGLVTILENFFVDGNLRPLVYNEHEGNTITVLKWNGNDLYCGDDVGKISVVSMTSLLTKTIFHVPSTTLMDLDSRITQIDTYKNYLLISTKTRTHLCNTEKEHFRQIGKKLRDGNFGACFSSFNNVHPLNDHQPMKGSFKTVQEGEDFASGLNDTDIKIFCARPGLRLWESNFEASVLVTYQFKNSLDRKASEIVVIKDSVDARFHSRKPDFTRQISKRFSFGKIYPILHRFILTFDSNGLYFFEPEMSDLPYLSYDFTGILDIRIVKSYIYIWREGFQLNVVSLQPLEDLLVTTLLKKQYYLCSELCLHYNEELRALVEHSEKLHILASLKTKLVEIGAAETLIQLKSIMDILEENYKRQSPGLIPENRKVVENQLSMETGNNECDFHSPESVQKFNSDHFDESLKSFQDHKDEIKKDISCNNVDNNIMALHRQYILNKNLKHFELKETECIFKNLNFENLFILLQQFIKFVKEKYNDDATIWCQEQIINYIGKDHCRIDNIDMKSLQYLSDCFIAINKRVDVYCKCNIPLPKAHTKKNNNYKLACKLFDRMENKNEYLNNIPHLYKYKLKKVTSQHEVIINLPVITQFSDKEVFKEFMGLLTYDSWDEIIKLFIKLKQGLCVNCGVSIDIDDALTWSEFGLLMVGSIGPKNAVNLLKQYSQYIPEGELDAKFYQSCMFSTTCGDQGLALNFIDKVVNSHNSLQFGEMIGRFLYKKYLGGSFPIDNGAIASPTEMCSVCELPVNTSVLVQTNKCHKGHSYHSICYSENNKICKICMINR